MRKPTNIFKIKRNPFAPARLLTIDPDFLKLEGTLADTRFTKEDIEGFRYGVSNFEYTFLPISRSYSIEVKNSQGKILGIRMHVLFGIRNKKTENLFIEIYRQIHLAYFNDMAVHYVQLMNEGLGYQLSGALLTEGGVVLKKDREPIPWIRVGLMSYYHSCSIYDLSNPSDARSFDYWHDWNAALLRTVVEFKIQKTTYELLR